MKWISDIDYDDTYYTNINYKAVQSIELLPGLPDQNARGVSAPWLGACPDLID